MDVMHTHEFFKEKKQKPFIRIERPIEVAQLSISELAELGRNLERRGYQNEARKCYKEIAKAGCQFTSLSLIAQSHYDVGEYDLAESYFLESLLHTTTEPDQLFQIFKNLGNLYLKTSQIENAQKFYLKAQSINPRSDDLFVNLGTLDIQKGDEALALEKFRHALIINEKNTKAWCGLSLVYESFGERELAVACIKKALDIDPDNLNALHIFAQLSVKLKTFNEAIGRFENWFDKSAFQIHACLCLIELYIHNHDYIKARMMINLGFLWEPKNLALVTWDETLKSHGI